MQRFFSWVFLLLYIFTSLYYKSFRTCVYDNMGFRCVALYVYVLYDVVRPNTVQKFVHKPEKWAFAV